MKKIAKYTVFIEQTFLCISFGLLLPLTQLGRKIIFSSLMKSYPKFDEDIQKGMVLNKQYAKGSSTFKATS